MLRSARNGLSWSLSPFSAAPRNKAWLTLLIGRGSHPMGRMVAGVSSCINSSPVALQLLCSPKNALRGGYRPFSSIPSLIDLVCDLSTDGKMKKRWGSMSPRWISSKSSSRGGGGTKKNGDKRKGRNSATDSSSSSSSSNTDILTKAPPTQHEEWVAFQRAISVQGFETGQQTEVASRAKRGGRLVRRKQQKLRERDEDDPYDPRRFTDLAGGEFPPHRYGQEETERLLAQAYANLPERAGKRGTRNLKRQGRRWFLVRKVRKLYKHHMANFQVRKMAKRSEKVRLVKEVLEGAPSIRQSDRQYQAQVFARWSSRMEQRRVGAGGA